MSASISTSSFGIFASDNENPLHGLFQEILGCLGDSPKTTGMSGFSEILTAITAYTDNEGRRESKKKEVYASSTHSSEEPTSTIQTQSASSSSKQDLSTPSDSALFLTQFNEKYKDILHEEGDKNNNNDEPDAVASSHAQHKLSQDEDEKEDNNNTEDEGVGDGDDFCSNPEYITALKQFGMEGYHVEEDKLKVQKKGEGERSGDVICGYVSPHSENWKDRSTLSIGGEMVTNLLSSMVGLPYYSLQNVVRVSRNVGRDSTRASSNDGTA